MSKKKIPESGFEKEVDELKENLIHLKDTFLEHVSDVAEKIPEAAHESEEKIEELLGTHPLMSLGLAAAIGFIIGVLITRK